VTRLTLRLLALVASFLLGTAVALIDTTQAFACSCAGISTIRALRESDAVFRGTVKGTVYSEQVVASDHDTDACGLDPDLGSTWVIFAIDGIEGEGDRSVNRLITTLCSGNLPSGIAPVVLGRPTPPLNGASDREEKSTNTDRIVTRGLAYAGIGALCIGAIALIGLGMLWRPGRSG